MELIFWSLHSRFRCVRHFKRDISVRRWEEERHQVTHRDKIEKIDMSAKPPNHDHDDHDHDHHTSPTPTPPPAPASEPSNQPSTPAGPASMQAILPARIFLTARRQTKQHFEFLSRGQLAMPAGVLALSREEYVHVHHLSPLQPLSRSSQNQ